MHIRAAKKILDIGCGTGLWALEMAELLPECEVIGIDISPAKFEKNAPSNLSFQSVNARQTLPYANDSFDLVNLRIVPDLSLNKEIHQEIARVLRPGGIFNTVALGAFWSPNDTYGPTFKEFNTTIGNILSRGFNRVSGEVAPGVIRESGRFRDISDLGVDIPIGPWMSGVDKKYETMGTQQRENCIELLYGFGPMLLRNGVTEETLQRLQTDAKAELNDDSRHVFWRYHLIHAIAL